MDARRARALRARPRAARAHRLSRAADFPRPTTGQSRWRRAAPGLASSHVQHDRRGCRRPERRTRGAVARAPAWAGPGARCVAVHVHPRSAEPRRPGRRPAPGRRGALGRRGAHVRDGRLLAGTRPAPDRRHPGRRPDRRRLTAPRVPAAAPLRRATPPAPRCSGRTGRCAVAAGAGPQPSGTPVVGVGIDASPESDAALAFARRAAEALNGAVGRSVRGRATVALHRRRHLRSRNGPRWPRRARRSATAGGARRDGHRRGRGGSRAGGAPANRRFRLARR